MGPTPRPVRVGPGLLVCLLVLAGSAQLTGGCARARDRRAARPHLIRELRLQGVKRFDVATLHAYTRLGVTSRWPWGERVRYDGALARVDARRLRDLYAAFGYHRAVVSPLLIEPLDPEDPEPVRVTVRVEEGEVTQVAGVEFVWGPSARPPAAAAIEARGALKVGGPFEVTALNEAVAGLRVALGEHGYALATVQEEARVDRAQGLAHVRFSIDAGPRCTVGRVRLHGLHLYPAAPVQREVVFAEGEPYHPLLVRRIEAAAYGLDVFGAALVQSAPPPSEQGVLDLDLQLSERPLQSLKLGVGLGFEPTRWDERLTALYTHRSLFGDLTRLDLRTRVGWAQLPTPWLVEEQGPVFSIEPRLQRRGWLERHLVWSAAPSYELGLEPGYRYHRPALRLGVSRFFFGRLQAQLGYSLELWDFFRVSSLFSSADTGLGLDFRDPYLLGYATADLRWYGTDRLVEPTRGVVLGVAWDVAGGPLLGGFDFQRVRPSLRAYLRPVGDLQLALRAETGWILPRGPEGSAPISMTFKLGGADTVRGWGLSRLSPQLNACGDPGACESIPVGGYTLVLGNLELRHPLGTPSLLGALFLDIGDVQTEQHSYDVERWNVSAGGGLRAVTPIGRFRLDAAWRLNDPPDFAHEPRWAVHLSLGEAF